MNAARGSWHAGGPAANGGAVGRGLPGGGRGGSGDGGGAELFRPAARWGDLYIVKGVLYDWPDREATAILKRCAEAARPSGRVVVFTGAGPGEEASPELLMMVLGGGRGRTLDELREMAREAGLEVKAVGRQASGRVIVECRPI